MVQLLRDNRHQVSGLPGWNVKAGRLFFRFRNVIFPILFVLFLATLHPQRLFPSPALDRLAVAAGVALVALGEGVRLTTIGYDYIDRGGKKGRPAANRLVLGGIYAHTRNPMYLGNILIAIGFAMASGSRAAYGVIIPFFLFVYQAITCAEEEFLRERFGEEYTAYCARVPRFLPDFRGLGKTLTQGRYDWRRPFKQDLSTIVWISLMLGALPLWHAYFLKGAAAARQEIPGTLWREGAILALYAVLVYCKKRRWLFYPPGDRGPMR